MLKGKIFLKQLSKCGLRSTNIFHQVLSALINPQMTQVILSVRKFLDTYVMNHLFSYNLSIDHQKQTGHFTQMIWAETNQVFYSIVQYFQVGYAF